MKDLSTSLFLVIILGCNGSVVSPEHQTPRLDEAFELKVGQSATINNLSFKVDSVPQDSRCPKNVVCIWTGNGTIVLNFSDGPDTLNTALQPQEINHNGYTIRLIQLAPYPEYPQGIPKDAYIVKLVVTKS